MAFYLIGLGLDKGSISADALEVLKKCDNVYLENYTVDFPYSLKELGFEFEGVGREKVEDESILKEANEKNVALLVYGDALSATTHMQLILACKKLGIDYRIFHNASIMTAIAETGLQPYKFGKTASMPNWKEHTNKPMSFIDYIRENQKIGAHTLILTDIGLEVKDAIAQLKESGFDGENILVVSRVGVDGQKIIYGKMDSIRDVEKPYCLIVPGKLNYFEEEVLRSF
ncbi:MAG: diphthine synthase [archaeon]|nr:diphthine synthase [archaeon]MCR4323718.1 diphthine synthase [Nanoarchaeota archaeon]